MHMWHHVTNHLIISTDKDSNSENRIKLRVRDNLGFSLCSTSLILFVSHSALSAMAGSRKRAPSTPKRTPKRPKTTGKQKELPGGALEMSFQLDGVYYQPECRLINLHFY
jgi:hypothetical protein